MPGLVNVARQDGLVLHLMQHVYLSNDRLNRLAVHVWLNKDVSPSLESDRELPLQAGRYIGSR